MKMTIQVYTARLLITNNNQRAKKTSLIKIWCNNRFTWYNCILYDIVVEIITI